MPNIIQFNTGAVEYDINGTKVLINPTDLAFVERVFNTFDTMDKMQEEYQASIDKAGNDAEALFAVYREMEDKMRGLVNEVFDEPDICGSLFGRVSVFALSDGLPLWANLMLALIDEMDTAFAREKKLTNPRIKKYTAKYQMRGKK